MRRIFAIILVFILLINTNIMYSYVYAAHINQAQITKRINRDKEIKSEEEQKSRTTNGDPMVYLTQRWLNQEYGNVSGFGSVPENGKTGWDTVYGLLRALQHELGITNLANSFGPSTTSLYQQNLLYRQDGVTDRKFAILQGALWCKGYNPGYYLYEQNDGTVVFDEIFNESVENAVVQLKTDAGLLNPDGVVSVNVMKALMSMDSFKLLSAYGGKPEIRSIQQKLNRQYEAYTGLNPCDGVYGRNTNKALIFSLQACEGLPVSIANGNFGNTTVLCCPTIPYFKNSSAAKRYPGNSSGRYYTQNEILSFTELIQMALVANGFSVGEIDGLFDSQLQQTIRNFQKKHAILSSGVADKSTWMSLLTSCGDKNRSAKAADCATILTQQKAATLYNSGYRFIGRYLTGTYNGGISKAITREEAQIIFNAGLRFFPIYQTSGRQNSYFTPEQGVEDAQDAYIAATSLGLPQNTIIYFAVDYDCLDSQITTNVIPYFQSVFSEMSDTCYKVGIYGTRNVCSRVSNLGYACSSFVADMSTGFSGNLGFSMPDNWAFDQFSTITIGSGSGRIEIDKDGFSGKDQCVSKLNPGIETSISNSLVTGNIEGDTLSGPIVNVLGQNVPLFELDVGFNFGNAFEIETNYDSKKKELQVLMGYNLSSVQTESGGSTTKAGKFRRAYIDVKNTVSSFGKGKQEFLTRYKDIKGSLYQRGVKVGFDCNANIFGFFTIDAITGTVNESGVMLVGNVKKSISYPIVPTIPVIVLKLGIEGSVETGLKIVFDSGTTLYNLQGNMGFSVSPQISIGVDALVANAFVGFKGTLDCGLSFPFQSLAESLQMSLSAKVFFEYQALFWGDSFEWSFWEHQLYPTANNLRNNTVGVSKEKMKFIEPILHRDSEIPEPDEGTIETNSQIYCRPKIVDLGNGKMLLLYISDSTNRSSVNRSILMYSVYDAGEWSTPLPVLDDYTADFEPEVCADGLGGAHVLWKNCSQVLNSNVTFDEMCSKMDLYYSHWNGTSFENSISVTNNNTDYEMAHKIVSLGNKIDVIWQQNSMNDAFSLSGTNSIYRREYSNGVWNNVELIVNGLKAITSLAASYSNGNNIIVYTAKTNTDLSDTSDSEVFVYNGLQVSQLTDDLVADYSVAFLNQDLYWISNDSIVCLPNLNINEKTLIAENMLTNVKEIKPIITATGKKAIVWQQEKDLNSSFYGVITNQNEFGPVEPLSVNKGILRGWDACIKSNGKIDLVYCSGEILPTAINGKPYSQLDLKEEVVDKFYDLYVDPIATFVGSIVPEDVITVFANVFNTGSLDVNQVLVKILNGETILSSQIVNIDLPIGEVEEISIPFALPETIESTEYSLQIVPNNILSDFTMDNNMAEISIGAADLKIENVVEERTVDGRNISITVVNQGFSTINQAELKIYNERMEGTLLSTSVLTDLDPNDSVCITYHVSNSSLNPTVSENPRRLFVVVQTDEEEMNIDNNNEWIYVYPDYNINTVCGSGGTVSGGGIYEKGATAMLEAIPSEGYIFDGWYENGNQLYQIAEEYVLTVSENRNLEARFKENDLTISSVEVFGDLLSDELVTFTVNVTGGVQPLSFDYCIVKNNSTIASGQGLLVNMFEWTPNETGEYMVTISTEDLSGEVVITNVVVNIN